MNARVGQLHVITDEALQGRWSHVEIARAAAAGGADVVQYRDKRRRTDVERLNVARAIVEALRGSSTCCVVNDHPALARSAGADGVHLGKHDPLPGAVREEYGERLWIGSTANNLDEALRCDAEPVDYLGVGPVFGTQSKASPAPTLGLDGLARIVAAVDRPVIAIGAIGAESIQGVLETGAWGVAVLSAVVLRENPVDGVAELRAAMDAAIAELEVRA